MMEINVTKYKVLSHLQRVHQRVYHDKGKRSKGGVIKKKQKQGESTPKGKVKSNIKSYTFSRNKTQNLGLLLASRVIGWVTKND